MNLPTKDSKAGKAMILTDRDRRLIDAVADFGILTRDQIARHLRFGSITRVNAVLLRLVRHDYLTRRVQPTLRGTRRQTYMIGLRGIELLEGCADSRRNDRRRWRESSDLFVEHRLLVNDVRLAFHHQVADGYVLREWLTETALRRMNLGFIPDAYAEYAVGDKTFSVFIEADNGTETLTRWRNKVCQYRDLAFSGRYRDVFGRKYFRVLVLLPSDRRLQTVRSEVARHTQQLFWLTTFEELRAGGLLATTWRRPSETPPQSLTSLSS